MEYSKVAEDPCCFTGVHFTDQDICIQSLRPNHYEEHFIGEGNRPLSEFVKSIIDTRCPLDQEEWETAKDVEESCSLNSILKDITNDLKAEPRRYNKI